MNSCATNVSYILSFIIWFFIIYFLIVFIYMCCTGNSIDNYNKNCYRSNNIAGVIFWIFFIIIILILLCCDEDYNKCSKCNKSSCSCNKNFSHETYTTKFNTNGKSTKNIEISTYTNNENSRSVFNLKLNGTECKNDKYFSCDPQGFSQVFNIPLPKHCDALVGIDINKPIELLTWIAPHGTEFTVNYLIPHSDLFIIVKSPENIVATGEIKCVAQNNLFFGSTSTVN
jgi:hypothetical protein